GCALVKQEWVENHWPLILWKLAGTVCSRPELWKDLWNFKAVCDQLLYRYEREINRGQRPAVRLVQERDAPAARPMILCVTRVEQGYRRDEDGKTVSLDPELELTDGWYKIRATTDAVLARAVKRRRIRVGTKLAMSGIYLDGRKEGTEVLKALECTNLALTGNSTTLARWDAKLGFSPRPFVATLGSLTADGGCVMLLDVVIVRAFAIGYIETHSNGQRDPPRCRAEEEELDAKWNVSANVLYHPSSQERRSDEQLRLRNEIEKKILNMEALADRLDRLSGGFYDIFDELEDAENPSDIIKGCTPKQCGYLSLLCRNRCESQKETAAEELERELNIGFDSCFGFQSRCPPRQVRPFCVVRIKDARTSRKPSLRTAQLTVWDLASLGEGALAEGQRYLISNLNPSQQRSWQKHTVSGEIFLSTRKDTKWKRMY
ncbi:hypothetical protein BOTBODRAFT_108380, partial [Botryobasidium botryosum FD-172 SS1]